VVTVRGRTLALPFATLWLLSAACGHLGTTKAAPSPTPDPSTAIVLSVLDHAIYLVDPTTGVRSQVVGDLPDFLAGYAAWAPDHTRLAYGKHGLQILNIDGQKTRLLAPGEQVSMPAWSPSGDVLAYGDGASLWITPVVELRPFQIQLPATLAPLGMDWSGDSIAFQGIRRDCARSQLCPTTEDSDIWTVEADGHGLERVTRIRRALAPKWSPDGGRILFIRRFAGDRQELWVVGAAGAQPRQLGTARDVIAADWSPDGNRIVMARRGTQAQTIRLWTTDSSGANARPLGAAVPGTDATLDW
jgi:Tol biopolymer transport system component